MKATEHPTLDNCVNTLLGKLIAAQTDLEDLQRRAFPRKNETEQMAQLANEIRNLEQRLAIAERLQDTVIVTRINSPCGYRVPVF